MTNSVLKHFNLATLQPHVQLMSDVWVSRKTCDFDRRLGDFVNYLIKRENEIYLRITNKYRWRTCLHNVMSYSIIGVNQYLHADTEISFVPKFIECVIMPWDAKDRQDMIVEPSKYEIDINFFSDNESLDDYFLSLENSVKAMTMSAEEAAEISKHLRQSEYNAALAVIARLKDEFGVPDL